MTVPGSWCIRKLAHSAAACFAVFLALFGMAGCTQSDSSVSSVGATKPQRLLLVGCDRTRSMAQADLDQASSIIASEVRETIRLRLNQKVWIAIFGRQVEEKYGPVTPSNRRDVYPILSDYVRGGPAFQDKGTFYGPVLKRFYDLSRDMGPDAVVYGFLLTDGGCDDPKEAKAAAKQLAELKQFRALLITPVRSAGTIRNKLRAVFTDDTKFLIAGPTELEAKRKELKEKIQ